jgi:hypothetical protein
MGLPKPGFTSEVYSLHLLYDEISTGGLAGEGLSQGDVLGVAGFADNLFGRRSGLLSAANGGATYSQPVLRPQGAPYEDTNSGATVTYPSATTITDTGKNWGVGDANSGGTVTYGANTLTDTARNNANAWVAGNTAQYAGLRVITATGKSGVIASVALGVITLTANWEGGTPAAGEAYFFGRGLVGRQIRSVSGGVVTTGTILYHINQTLTINAWSNGTPAANALYTIQPPPVGPHVIPGGTARPGAENSDNYYKAIRELGNTEAA